MLDLSPERFEALVAEALDLLPEDLAARMDNVVVRIRDESPWEGVLGLYEGIPLTEREAAYTMVLPDRITLYRDAILERCSLEADVVTEIRVTVVHEVAHHFGIDDDRLEELGWG